MYLLDANTLIEAKNRYYSMAVCPAYWEWIIQKHEALEVASISLVAEELRRGNDELAQWVATNSALFIDVSDAPTQNAFAAVAGMLVGAAPKMKAGALEDFLAGADPWLIAKAVATNAVVVTHEVFNPDIKRKFSIPNVCAEFGVRWINTFELLQALDAKFVLAA